MKKIIISIAISLTINVSAQTWVTIPDANLVTYLQSIIPTAMSGNQMNINNTLVTTTTQTINVANKSIANLSGVQYFTSLTYLYCDSNTLTSLPTLPNTLIWLDCSYNSITTLPVLPNSLITLFCGYNSLASLPVLPSALHYLYCNNNSLTILPTLNSLTALDCEHNSLTNLPTLPNSITWFVCASNSITNLPALPNALQYLYCNSNNIACFPTFPNSITTLAIDPNPYNCLPNHIAAMSAADLAIPLCTIGNVNGCAVATSIQTHNQTGVNIFSYGNAIITNGTIPQGQQLKVYNALGQVVLTTALQNNIETNLPSGIYTIQVIDNTGSIIEIKKCALINN